MNPLIGDLARKAGYHISCWQFFQLGFLLMIGSMVLSAVYLWHLCLR